MSVKKEFPKADPRLREWVDWNRKGGYSKELELPSQSSHLNMSGGSYNQISGNERAEEMDKLVSRINKLWPETEQVIELFYVKGYDSISEASGLSDYSRTTFDRYFQRAMGWFEGVLK
ncbi:MAG: hypothetical protein KZQ83_14840 [gamma proteobacterium symbiont of Taylorina sp.]|nr:hypothetical protein [gamma proteobacterium symbiont of Taylorina sp.]